MEETVKHGSYVINYENKDITKSIAPYVLEVIYEDKESNESDCIEIRVDDTDAKWRDAWYPSKGDKIIFKIGKGDVFVDCGTFTVDEIELEGQPDTVTIKAIATSFKKATRTKKSVGYEKSSIKQIAQAVASANGLKFKGNVEDIKIDRVTQNVETDLCFLKRLSDDFGYVFSIRNDTLFFNTIYELEKGKVVRSIDRSQLSRYQIKDKTAFTFKSAKVEYKNPDSKLYIGYTETNKDNIPYSQIDSENVLVVKGRVENKQQAIAKAKAALYNANSKQQSGTLTIFGDPLLIAGNSIELTGMGQMSGKYYITKSKHRITRSSGYITEIDIKRVGFVEKVKTKPKAKKEQKPVDVRIIGSGRASGYLPTNRK